MATPALYAFDFDGVLCDSARETARVGIMTAEKVRGRRRRESERKKGERSRVRREIRGTFVQSAVEVNCDLW